MKEISKFKRIVKGFFPDEVVTEDILKYRREACDSCQFNSSNTESDELSTIDYLRNKVTKPFCTLCKCQIFEKTQSPFEECAMYMIDKEKKWFKTRIETMGNDINITNLSELKIDLRLENDKFIVDYGELSNGDPTDIELLIDSNSSDKFKLFSVHATCGCVTTKFSTLDNKGYINLKVNLLTVGKGKHRKTVNMEYLVNGKPLFKTIVVEFFKK